MNAPNYMRIPNPVERVRKQRWEKPYNERGKLHKRPNENQREDNTAGNETNETIQHVSQLCLILDIHSHLLSFYMKWKVPQRQINPILRDFSA